VVQQVTSTPDTALVLVLLLGTSASTVPGEIAATQYVLLVLRRYKYISVIRLRVYPGDMQDASTSTCSSST